MEDELRALLAPAGQEHVLQYWGELLPEQQAALHRQVIAEILPTLPAKDGLSHLNNLYRVSNRLFIEGASRKFNVVPPGRDDVIRAVPVAEGDAGLAALVDRQGGLRAVRERRCAVVVLAGGAGTRLGHSFPKGMLVCPTLSQGKSLFQLHCEKVRRVEMIAGADPGSLQICFMTSETTDAETRGFFASHRNFGLQPEQLSFTKQSSLPCFAETPDPEVGKLILAEKHRIAMAPGGNAGVYEALARGGVLEHFEQCGVSHVQIFTVDNILARIGDPDFFGLALRTGAEIAVKSTPKAHDHEAVGVFARIDGKWGVVEYSEIGKEMAEARDAESGERLFNCANIAIHLCTLSFLRVAAERMASFYFYHIAKKPIATVVSDKVQGQASADGKVPGVKMEAFIFDLFQFAEQSKFKIVQVDRSEEFSAIKNADDGNKKDSPTSAVQDLQRLHYKWLARAARTAIRASNAEAEEGRQLVVGVQIADLEMLEQRGATDGIVEISPLASYGGENLDEFVTGFLERVRDVIAAGFEDGAAEAQPCKKFRGPPLLILSPLERSHI